MALAFPPVGVRDAGAPAAAAVLAANAAVGAVAEAGSFTGRVGDLGRGFVFDVEESVEARDCLLGFFELALSVFSLCNLD